MEPWFIESQARTAELTAKWENAPIVQGTGSFTVKGSLPLSEPTLPWLEPATGQTDDGDYALAVGAGSIEMPKGSGKYYLILPMRAMFPRSVSSDATECDGTAFPGQVAECGGWVVRVTDAYPGGGQFELLSYPKIPGYKLTWGAIGPVADEVPTVIDGTP